MKNSRLLVVYGSYGYTGTLIVELCKQKNLQVMLAGRNLEALQKRFDRFFVLARKGVASKNEPSQTATTVSEGTSPAKDDADPHPVQKTERLSATGAQSQTQNRD